MSKLKVQIDITTYFPRAYLAKEEMRKKE